MVSIPGVGLHSATGIDNSGHIYNLAKGLLGANAADFFQREFFQRPNLEGPETGEIREPLLTSPFRALETLGGTSFARRLFSHADSN